MLQEHVGQTHKTFRDPAGSVELRPEGVFRSVREPHATNILAFLATPLATELVADGRLVASEVLESTDGTVVLRHPRIPFISYPWEWPSALWLAAARLTTDLCQRLVGEGWVLKDATPLNILFQGTTPIFVDVLSVERLDSSSPIWLAYGQYVRTLLLPLLAHAELGWPLSTAQLRRDGFEPEDIFAALPWPSRLNRVALTSVTLPVVLGRWSRKASGSMKQLESRAQAASSAQGPEINKKILLKRIAGLRTATDRIAPPLRPSTWSGYVETAGHYSGGDHEEKRQFVAETLRSCSPRNVLDVGCNTGVYSRIAADAGAAVVSIDTDTGALDRLCTELRGTGKNILPLCVDLAYATPALGWENRETLSFLQRCEGHFDLVMMLAVIHHLLLSSQIPMEHIASLCSRITTKNLILEWVPPTDPKFVEVLRGREAIYGHVTEEALRTAFARYFHVSRELLLSNGRILFHFTRQADPNELG